MLHNNAPADLAGEIAGIFGAIYLASELQTRFGFGPLVFLVIILAGYFAASGLGTFVAVFDDDTDDDDED